jgi:hypothetical protein
LTISLGLGMSGATQTGAHATADGFYGEGEYWIAPLSWLQLRSFAGVLLTSTDPHTCSNASSCDVSERILFGGGKIRLLAPIPYVAPYVETGLGLSFGSIRAVDVNVDQRMNGITYNIPFAFGLALGEYHTIDLGLGYLFHPAAWSLSGALAVGLTFRLN